MYSSTQLLELFVVLCTADHFRYAFSRIGKASADAQSKSGPVRPDSMPTPLSVRITPIQGLTHLVVPILYVLSVIGSGFRQPPWMSTFALPEVACGSGMDGLWKNATRVLACVASIALQSVSDRAFNALGDQFHPIGRREKSRIVQTGPYAQIRHPLYACVFPPMIFDALDEDVVVLTDSPARDRLTLLNEALWSLMFWSYAPLYTLVASATVFAIKIPIEEGAILNDAAVREEYSEYMRKVPVKIVPYVW